jgi:gas vesicle protein
MEHTPYYRSPTSIVSILAGAAAGVAAATLFDPPSGGVTPAKVRRKVRAIDDDAALALDGKRSYS